MDYEETEKQRRDNELLKSIDDYLNTIKELREVNCGTRKADKKIDETLLLLACATKEKIDCVINESKRFRKKQSLLSKWKDKRAERKRIKAEKKAIEEAEKEEPQEENEEKNSGLIEYAKTENAKLAPSQLSKHRLLGQQTNVEVVEDEKQDNPSKEE